MAMIGGRQFITQNVHLCLQHYGHNAVHRARLSTAVETCSLTGAICEIQKCYLWDVSCMFEVNTGEMQPMVS